MSVFYNKLRGDRVQRAPDRGITGLMTLLPAISLGMSVEYNKLREEG